jgi:hypothetical protein
MHVLFTPGVLDVDVLALKATSRGARRASTGRGYFVALE